jgi:hypothetical protein
VWNLAKESGSLGVMFVTNLRVVWYSENNINLNVSVPYLRIVRKPPCIYTYIQPSYNATLQLTGAGQSEEVKVWGGTCTGSKEFVRHAIQLGLPTGSV